MEAIEGTINDLMIHSQFDSNTHASSRIKLLPADRRGRQHAVVWHTSAARRRTASWEPSPRQGYHRCRGHRDGFLFCLPDKQSKVTDTFGNGFGPLVVNCRLCCVCCGLQWTHQQGFKANQNQQEKRNKRKSEPKKNDQGPAPSICCPCLIKLFYLVLPPQGHCMILKKQPILGRTTSSVGFLL